MISMTHSGRVKPLDDKTLLEALTSIHDDESLRNDDTGICSSIDSFFNRRGYYTSSEDTHEIRYLMSLWSKFSGKVFYPVPSTNPRLDASEIFFATQDMWNQETEYGKLRWELLEFCIKRLEDRIYEDRVS